MSLGENLQFLRKKNDITQEQLAEKLDVSRQSISKWESDTTYPEMDKLIQLCQLFHVSMDDLVQKDVGTLYVEDKAKYDEHFNLFSKMMALGTGLILLGVSIMLFLSGIGVGINAAMNINEELCSIVFFIFLIIAVAIFIVIGLQHDNFEKKNPYIENFYSAEEIEKFNKKFSYFIAAGVVLILISLVVFGGLESLFSGIQRNSNIDLDSITGAIFLFFVAIAVTIFVYAGIQKSKYDIDYYNKIHDKESDTYKKDKIKSGINGCLMMVAVIIYLICGFVFDGWGMPHIVIFPVFAILCAISSAIINMKYPENQ
ncbi:MAG: helix-turn-helix domain-containing protein [Roseburia sp.]|nr:helix-turn-helix domain-containing protein [Roseburia sp.]MCM1241244.1 helix-turn-helix domain-containing protein [Roseburia sp.]